MRTEVRSTPARSASEEKWTWPGSEDDATFGHAQSRAAHFRDGLWLFFDFDSSSPVQLRADEIISRSAEVSLNHQHDRAVGVPVWILP